VAEEYRLPQLRDFLDRFRPAGAPGASGRAAVPVDRSRELAAELLPVLTLLDDTDAECAGMVEHARDEAARIAAAARAAAAKSRQDASSRAAAVRAEAMQHAVATARAEVAGAVADARAEARDVTELSSERIPVLAGRAVALVRALGAPGSGPAGGWPGRRREPGGPS
jgi:vacuolar-type H+-ATPase subunit H